MFISLRQRFLITVSAIVVIFSAIYVTGLFYFPTKTLAQRSPCAIIPVTPIKNKNGQVIGTFPCVTFTPTPSPSPTPPPTPTPLPVPTSKPATTCQLEGEHNGCACAYTPADSPPVQEIVCSMTNNCELVNLCNANNWPSWKINVYTIGGQSLFVSRPFRHQINYILDCSYLRRTLAGGREYCLAKPVIYLYPERPTVTSVSITTVGNIFVSIPHYAANGWEHILAFPNGKLLYQGQQFTELYYETNVTDVKPPPHGIILNKKSLRFDLSKIVKQLGLNQSETDEFLAYWLPTLTAQKGDYMLFSLIDPTEKDRIDHVAISPVPQTRIEFLAYFKPLKTIIDVTPLILPETPTRKGYTEVEWGGTIDLN